MAVNYQEDDIVSLDWREHIRFRPGMYIGKLGNGSASDDGIYLMIKEILDNSVDEFVMGFGKKILLDIEKNKVRVRDFGRGIPLGKVYDCVARINTGGKYDSGAFKKSVGLNGVGTKVVNALSKYFMVESVRDGESHCLEFSKGELTHDHKIRKKLDTENGTEVVFIPDESLFGQFEFTNDFVESMVWNYVYLNTGLSIILNGKKFYSTNGLFDLLEKKIGDDTIYYPIIHLKCKDLEIAFTHGKQYGEQYFSFVNGQYTPQGGSHLLSFRESLVRVVREFYKKDFDSADIRSSIIAAISIRVEDPIFESQTKTKLGSLNMGKDGVTIRSFINDFLRQDLDNFLHKNTDTANELLKRILESEKERKEIAGIRKIATQRSKKTTFFNKKLRDCRYHFDEDGRKKDETMIFLTEGDSASGSLTQARDVDTQAIFSLRGKPLNTFGLTKKIVYSNEEFHCLQHALNIEDGLDGLRYKYVIIATDADVDGMHIRLLLLTFFLQFFPELVRKGHLHILETPLFRVRTRQQTLYCYNESERDIAIQKLGKNSEITRFKGLGEISPVEFRRFIQEDIHLTPVLIKEDKPIKKTLEYYMGKNTPERQQFIIENLQTE